MYLHAGHKPRWMVFDDDFVEEGPRRVLACAVVVLYPLYWISFSQMNDNMTSQAATKTTNGVPNDVINNTNPIALMVLIPVFDALSTPSSAGAGTTLRRSSASSQASSMVVSSAMVWVRILQWYVYTTYPSCGYGVNDLACGPSPISVWWQTGSYVLMYTSSHIFPLTR
ncbi:hypothetical protein CALVIDRAFT_410879 [Calocera viscosa TUFC12733]|uniref:Uncharacterized protein n=1 Tax=Calocera viscosa (strain TUFC12733) TaxID=1330018 RepID=A0A167G770_CALVF|nr:hypothetical protein CALVIDRAFT_410879 [Calocera viscosa TUFC12733]